MRLEIRRRAQRDADAVRDKYAIEELEDFMRDALRLDIAGLEARYDFRPLRDDPSFYRLRIENYRLGCRYDNIKDILIIMRFLHREIMYDCFP